MELIDFCLSENNIPTSQSNIPYLEDVNNGYLSIEEDHFLDLRFIDKLGVTHLNLHRCTDTYFQNCSKNITHLTINSSQLSYLEGIQQMEQLEKLVLMINYISDITSIGGLINLNYLSLASNLIEDINAIQYLTNLNFLDLCENKIIEISSLRQLKRLNTLYLSFNQIIDASPIIDLNIAELYLSNNHILETAHFQQIQIGVQTPPTTEQLLLYHKIKAVRTNHDHLSQQFVLKRKLFEKISTLKQTCSKCVTQSSFQAKLLVNKYIDSLQQNNCDYQ
ncbi:Conserved_hypothetical protein [Hexamita inflata]|uniref:Uncharacterized protein n=1 Tax=Hexamita inflata TaxID=28002 RepID=A0AA86NWV8_9EUKA|nr:Conserved hypothetical protein [Hexamita inflata]